MLSTWLVAVWPIWLVCKPSGPPPSSSDSYCSRAQRPLENGIVDPSFREVETQGFHNRKSMASA